jgi:hypothetical protein
MLTNNGTERVKSNGMVWALGAAAIGAAAMAMGGHAANAAFTSGLVDVQFYGTNQSTVSGQASGAGVIGLATDYWNTVTEGSTTNTVAVNVTTGSTGVGVDNVTGGASGATLTVAGTGGGSGTYIGSNGANDVPYLSPSTTVNFNLLNGNMGTYGTTVSPFRGNVVFATIGGLDPSLEYNLYVENGQDDTTYTVTGATVLTGTVNTYTDANTSAWVSGNDYYKFTLAPDANGNISLAYIYSGTGSSTEYGSEATVSGLQITPVPETANLRLLGLGGLGLLMLKRRRTA